MQWGAAGAHLGLGGAQSKKRAVHPTLVQGVFSGERVAQVALGNFFTIALSCEGRVYTFGWNPQGLLGLEEQIESVSLPTLVTALESEKCTFVSAGGVHVLATTDDGRVFAWGQNDVGQLGLGDCAPRHTVRSRSLCSLSPSRPLSCARTAPNCEVSPSLLPPCTHMHPCTQRNIHSPCNLVHVGPVPAVPMHLTGFSQGQPELIQGLVGQKVRMTSASCFTSAAVTEGNELWLWGWGAFGQLAQEDDDSRLSPVLLHSLANVSVVATHDILTICVIKAEPGGAGEVWVWGGMHKEYDHQSMPLGIDSPSMGSLSAFFSSLLLSLFV